MAVDTNVTNVVPAPESAGPETDEARSEPKTVPGSQSQQHVWSMPKPAVTRRQADELGRIVLKAGTATAGFISDVARRGARAVAQLCRAIGAVPPTVRLLTTSGVLMLLGMVGAISLHNSAGLACIIVVVPVCAAILGALGHRWYSGLDDERAPRVESPTAPAAVSDLQRSVEYVDKKLTVALNAFGSERQQHAMIALFQAKTAVELTLGTEQDTTSHLDVLLPVEIHDARPRIRAGSVLAAS